MRELVFLIPDYQATAPLCDLDTLTNEFESSVPIFEQSLTQNEFEREPMDRNVLTDQCPTNNDLSSAAEDLDEKIEDYENQLAIDAWIAAQLTQNCQSYDEFLKDVQTPQLRLLTGALPEDRILGVLEPLTEFNDKTAISQRYLQLTSNGEREEFISEQYQVGTAYKEDCGLSPDHYFADVAEVDSYNLFFGVF